MIKQCVVCGAGFTAPPSSKKATCSDACSRVRKQASHQGQPHPWTEAARTRRREQPTSVNLHRGTPAAQCSLLAGPFETNQEAKLWWVVHEPTNTHYEVRNLRKWCRDHADLFAPDSWELAYAGLRQVQAWLMGKRKRQVSRWKDWTLARPAEVPAASNAGG